MGRNISACRGGKAAAIVRRPDSWTSRHEREARSASVRPRADALEIEVAACFPSYLTLDRANFTRWVAIYEGAGIHGTEETASLGSAASHGCVRMSIPDVEDLYDEVEVGTPVFIG
jgi:lipoprotein-anchoring transpeptidase ErfK/SrfK